MCGAPTPGEVCAFCRLREQATSCPSKLADGRPTWRAPFAAGDRVLLVDAKRRRHLITLAAGGEFHTHAGVLEHDALIGAARRRRPCAPRSGRGSSRCGPTLAEYVLEMPRGAQVIYPKDLGPILILADVFPGAQVLESGVGSGALTLALLRAVGPTGHVTGYEIRDDFARRAQANVEGFLGPDVPLTVEVRDVYEGIDVDRPRPRAARPARAVAGREARRSRRCTRAASCSRTCRRSARSRACARSSPGSAFGMVETLEVLQRTWHVDGQSVRPDHRMVAHTGFLTHARLLAPGA